MNKYKISVFLIAFCFIISGTASGSKKGKKDILVLTYHHISKGFFNDFDTNTQKTLAQQVEYFRTHGYHFISVEDLVQAKKGIKKLPSKPVLLTFDDAYKSFYEFVFPLLKRLNCPAMVAVVGYWIDHPQKYLVAPLMSWKQLREVSESGLVEVASHTFRLHEEITYTPQGNVTASVAVLQYFPDKKRYETVEEYRERLRADFEIQKRLFREKLGFSPRVLVWPYGRFNEIATNEALKNGMLFTFGTEEGFNSLEDLAAGKRFCISADMANMEKFIDFIEQKYLPNQLRVVQADLDLIYDPNSPEQTDKNLGFLIDRLVAMGVDTVFLQAFADPEGTGTVKSVYFSNRYLPVRADIFAHACHQIMIRGISVYAWMPTLGIELSDKKLREKLGLRKRVNGSIKIETQRLSPFLPETQEILAGLYEDLASHALVSGILFQDDARLADEEGFSQSAIRKFYKIVHKEKNVDSVPETNDPRWIAFKTQTLDDLLEALKARVKTYRPYAKFARNVFSEVVLSPESQMWHAQSYKTTLKNYDYAVIMAYPEMEKVKKPIKWFAQLVNVVKKEPKSLLKTIFKIQTYNWQKDSWIDSRTILKRLRRLESMGVIHLAYYPDNVFENQPNLKTVRTEMSSEEFSLAEYEKYTNISKGE